MITDAIANAFFGALGALFTLIPDTGVLAGFTSEQTDNGYALGNAFGLLDASVPIATLVAAAAMLLLLEIALQGWDLIVWIFHQFWGSD